MAKKQVVALVLKVNPLENAEGKTVLPIYAPGAKLAGTGIFARVRAAFKNQYPGIKGAQLKKSVNDFMDAQRTNLNAAQAAQFSAAQADGIAGRTRRTASGKIVFEIEPLKRNKLEMSDEALIAMAKARGLELHKAPALPKAIDAEATNETTKVLPPGDASAVAEKAD